jgi:hypothetical protein
MIGCRKCSIIHYILGLRYRFDVRQLHSLQVLRLMNFLELIFRLEEQAYGTAAGLNIGGNAATLEQHQCCKAG